MAEGDEGEGGNVKDDSYIDGLSRWVETTG